MSYIDVSILIALLYVMYAGVEAIIHSIIWLKTYIDRKDLKESGVLVKVPVKAVKLFVASMVYAYINIIIYTNILEGATFETAGAWAFGILIMTIGVITTLDYMISQGLIKYFNSKGNDVEEGKESVSV